jgi:hypothetical protein
MKTKISAKPTSAVVALCLIAGSAAFAETQTAEDPMADPRIQTSRNRAVASFRAPAWVIRTAAITESPTATSIAAM